MSSQQANQLVLKKLEKRIRDLRKHNNFSQCQMAKKCAMDYVVIQRLKMGNVMWRFLRYKELLKFLKFHFKNYLIFDGLFVVFYEPVQHKGQPSN